VLEDLETIHAEFSQDAVIHRVEDEDRGIETASMDEDRGIETALMDEDRSISQATGKCDDSSSV